VVAEEICLEGQHEQSLELQLAGDLQQPVDDRVPDAPAPDLRVHRDGTHLAKIGP
jgi:hypothetical protein